ncbi:Uncharacterised protein [Yersinia kristensenii]|nr:Uncharacterised protein [Yersinia kristensenii]
MGSINAVQIGSRPICLSIAAFLQLELFSVYTPYFLSSHGIIGTALMAFFGEPSTILSE